MSTHTLTCGATATGVLLMARSAAVFILPMLYHSCNLFGCAVALHVLHSSIIVHLRAFARSTRRA
eukprot:364327-Chlamydomonas_euryale.AAC.6